MIGYHIEAFLSTAAAAIGAEKDALGKLKIFKFYEFLFYPEMGIFLLVTSDFSWYYKTKLGDLEGGHRDE